LPRLTLLLRAAMLVTAAAACYALLVLSADLRRLSSELDALGRQVTAMAEDLASVADDVGTLAEDVNAIANSFGCEEEDPQQHVPLRSRGEGTTDTTRTGAHLTLRHAIAPSRLGLALATNR